MLLRIFLNFPPADYTASHPNRYESSVHIHRREDLRPHKVDSFCIQNSNGINVRMQYANADRKYSFLKNKTLILSFCKLAGQSCIIVYSKKNFYLQSLVTKVAKVNSMPIE
jgi:hypothetical protein